MNHTGRGVNIAQRGNERPITAVPHRLHFFVPGRPAAQGSKRHVGNGRMIESSREVGPWRERIALTAHNAMLEAKLELFTTPLAVKLQFVLPRPKATPKSRTPAAVKKPDADKLTRAVFDALTSVCYRDDAQIVHIHVYKRLAELNETPGVYISLWEVFR